MEVTHELPDHRIAGRKRSVRPHGPGAIGAAVDTTGGRRRQPPDSAVAERPGPRHPGRA